MFSQLHLAPEILFAHLYEPKAVEAGYAGRLVHAIVKGDLEPFGSLSEARELMQELPMTLEIRATERMRAQGDIDSPPPDIRDLGMMEDLLNQEVEAIIVDEYDEYKKGVQYILGARELKVRDPQAEPEPTQNEYFLYHEQNAAVHDRAKQLLLIVMQSVTPDYVPQEGYIDLLRKVVEQNDFKTVQQLIDHLRRIASIGMMEDPELSERAIRGIVRTLPV